MKKLTERSRLIDVPVFNHKNQDADTPQPVYSRSSAKMAAYIPSMASAILLASLASPSMTGAIGWSSPASVKPAAVICSRNRRVLCATRPVSSEDVIRMSNTWREETETEDPSNTSHRN